MANADMRLSSRFHCFRPARPCPGGRRDSFPQLAERPPLCRYPIVELLVVVPFSLEEPIQDAGPQAIVSGISGVVKRVVSGARQHLAQPTIVVFRFQLEISVAE